ncbi:hypothetical protein AB0H63_10550 [Micromonospora echinospora]|uniref:hypothetical protein n=1 Tax=Micromonospora echinospora TaxID=1877 RepID=UPI0033CD2C63
MAQMPTRAPRVLHRPQPLNKASSPPQQLPVTRQCRLDPRLATGLFVAGSNAVAV